MTAILDPVKIATVSNLSVSSGSGGNVVLSFLNNSSAIDNGLLYNGDRVLVKDQTNPIQNGIYVVTNATQLTRATDMAYDTTATASCIVFVQQGSVHADTGWVLSSNTGAVTVGTSELTFLRFSVNRNVIGEDLEVTLIYREELGRPLTNIELDNNFKYLATALTDKLDIQNFNADQIANKLNAVTAEEANLNANRVRGYFPSSEATANTLTVRDSNGNLTATTFFGNLQGSASQLNGQAASFYRDATNINAGVLAVARGGTGASTASAAVTSLGGVHISGDTMTGKLTLVTSSSASSASLRIPNGSVANDLESGDLWSQDNVLKFRSGTTNKTIAFLENPQFEAPTLKDSPLVISNDNAVASTKFTHDVVDELATTVSTALGTKAPIESPSLTGTPNSTTPTQSDNSTRIATTAYVTTKVTGAIANVYSKIEVDGKITGVTGPTTRTIKQVDDDLQNWLQYNGGTPVGAIVYYPASTIPFGWMECDGRSLDKNTYASLFAIVGYTYGGSGNTFKLPDLRGEFVRGWDHGRGVDENRVLGSWQKGTLNVTDPNYGSHNTAGIIGRTNYAGGTTGIVDKQFVSEVGQDYVTRDTYPNAMLHWFNGTNAPLELGTSGFSFGATRPRNVALVPCIRAFGGLDDPNQILAQNVINDVAGKVNKVGDIMTGFLTLHAAPTQDLHASTKKYVDDAVANIDISTTAVLKSGSTMTGFLTLSAAPTQNLHASTKKYVDDKYEDLMANSGTPVGSILYYPSATIPFGWMQCDGRSLDKTAYSKLFDIIGYTYGGSGNTFKLPDLRGEFVRGWDNGRGVDTGRALNTSQSATAVRILIDQYAGGSGAKTDGTYLWKDRYPLGTFAVTGSNIDGFVTPGTGDASLMRYNASLDPTAGTPSNTITSGLGTVNVASNTTYYRASTSELAGNGDNVSFMVRPRNVALVACIKVFGNVDDPSQILAQNVINDVAGKVNKVGDTMSGFLTLHAAPAQDMHASTKKYVDDAVANIDVSSTAVMKAGSTMTGTLTLSGAPTQNLHAATKAYVDTQIASNISGGGSPIGSIVYYAAQNVPVGWMECDGRALDKNAYSVLFSVIGYTYGGGGNNFKLPDLRGEFIRGWDHGRGADIGRVFGTSQRGSQMMADDGNGVLGLITDASQQSRSRGSPYQLPEITWDKYDGLGSIAHAQVASLQPEGLNNYYHASQDPGYFYHARPRNVALVACIKVFGTVDDPNQILAQNVITDIAGKVNKTGDTMTGPLTLPGAPTQNLHAATKAYVDSKVGSNYTITSGNTQYAVNQPYSYIYTYDENGSPVYQTGQTNFTNIVGNWENAYNFFDVFPPSGKTMANLVAFLPSIAVIHYEGRVDGNDSLRCTWGIVNGDRIRVWVQNTEQRSGPAANWIAFWS